MRIFILLAVATLGQCNLLGSRKCTYGPSYWCSHIHHAKECGALQHCMDNVWKHQLTAKVGETETCFDVVKILNAVRKTTDDKLLDKMAAGCTGLPTESRTLCKKLMMNDKKEVHQILSMNLPSSSIASILGLCGGDKAEQSTPATTTKVSSDYCKDCTAFFGDIKEIVVNSKGQAEAAVKQLICTKLGPFGDLCSQLIDQYATMVYDIVEQQLNPQDLCMLLQLCGSMSRQELMDKILVARNQKGAECDVCKSVAFDVQQAIMSDTLQKDVMDFVEGQVCSRLPGDLATQCKSYVVQFGPTVFQVLAAELDPQTICQTVGMCGAKAQLTAVPLHPAGTVTILAPHTQTAIAKVTGGPQCSLCEFALHEIEEKLINDKSEAQIVAAVEEVCSILPSTIEKECTAFVEQYGKMIIKLLVQQAAPKVICTMIGLCVAPKVEAAKQEVALPKVAAGGEFCVICETGIGYAKAALDDPNNEKSVEQILDEICDLKVLASYKGLCEMLIKQYTPALINMLSQDLDAQQICAGLGLCSAKAAPAPAPLKFQPMMHLAPAAPRAHGALLGAKKCTFGPSYWCKSEENARECNVLDHCVQHYNLKVKPQA